MTAELLRQVAVEGIYGCEAPEPTKATVAMVVVRADRMSPRTASWIGDILGTGGYVLQVYSDPGAIDEPGSLDVDRRTVDQAHAPCRHYLQVIPEAWDGPIRKWRVRSSVSDTFERHVPGLVSFTECASDHPLQQWARQVPCDVDVCEAVEAARDGSRCVGLRESVLGHRVAELMLSRPPPPVMAYSARWTGVDPPCTGLGRIEVDGAGEVRVCRHGEVLGAVGDEPAVLKDRLDRQRMDAVERRMRAGLSEEECPQCPFPGLADDEYCRIPSDGNVDVWGRIEVLSRVTGILLRTQQETPFD
jgi:hypothetical protein